MEKNIAVIKGDGIGPEIVTEAMKVFAKAIVRAVEATDSAYGFPAARDM